MAAPSAGSPEKAEKVEKKVDESPKLHHFPSEPAPGGTVVVASPLARRIAREKNIDLSKVIGTGPGGRIVRKDIELAMASSAVSEVPARSSGDLLPSNSHH